MSSLNTLYKKLGYTFKQSNHLKMALTHRSYSSSNNERLEFLGDSLLNLIIANALYEHYPKAKEGELSRLRAHLVQEDSLSEIAQQLNIGHFLQLGMGELKTGGSERPSILADTVEAIIAAIFLDSNFEACQQFVLNIFHEKLHSLSSKKNTRDAKTTLQEYLQSRKQALPVYEIVETNGESHQQTFTIRCSVTSLKKETVGTSTSRRKAEQEAAKAFLSELGQA
jgi:ribonuclease-3